MTVTLCGAAPRRGRRSPDDSAPVKKPTPVRAVQDRATITREREGSVAAVVPPRLEVVTHRDRIQPVLFGRDRDLHQLARIELLRRRLETELEFCHEPRP